MTTSNIRMVTTVAVWVATSLGCRSRDTQPATHDRVNVRVPFVNVRVGEEGGAKVRAPFTNVETPRYQANFSEYPQNSATPRYTGEAAPSPRFAPYGTTQPYQPLPPSNAYQPITAAPTATSYYGGTPMIPPASPRQRTY